MLPSKKEDKTSSCDNDSSKSADIKENRKILNYLLRNLNSIKASPFEDIKKYTLETLRTCDKDITKIFDEDKNSFVHHCVRDEKVDFLRAIVESYFILVEDQEKFYTWFTSENAQNMTPFDIAAQKPNRDIIRFLFDIIQKTDETKLRITEKRNNLFHNAARKNECYPIIFFFEKLQKVFPQTLIIDVPNQLGITPLHYACYYGCRRAVDLLLDLGANINARDQDGNTSLHFAVHSGCLRTVKKLLVRGADKSIKGNNNQTPYKLALELNNMEIAKVLERKSVLRKLVCMEGEISAIKGSRNDLLLLIIEMLLIFFKIIYIARISYLLTGEERGNEILPFLPGLLNISVGDNVIKPFNKLVSCTFESGCITEITITLSSLFSDIFIICTIIYFICCTKKLYSRKKKMRSMRSLISLYEENTNICVKCREIIDLNTMHCIVCNDCVEEWDHHCFWLNTCINAYNKQSFNIFFGSLICGVTLNTLFVCFNLILSFKGMKNDFFQAFFGLDILMNDVEYVRYAWICTCSLLLVCLAYIIFFIVFPILKGFCERNIDNRTTVTEYESKLISRSVNGAQSLNSYSL